jgi:hypothetical protein
MIGAPPPKPRPPIARRKKRWRAKAPVHGESTRVQILQVRRGGVPKARLSRSDRAAHRSRAADGKGELSLLLPEQGRDPVRVPSYSLDRLIRLIDEISASDESPDNKLRTLIVALVHTILDELHGTTLFIDLVALTPAHLKTIIGRRDRVDRGMRQIISDGAASGTFGNRDAKLLSFAILGAVNWIPRWFKPDGPASSDDRRRFANYPLQWHRRG